MFPKTGKRFPNCLLKDEYASLIANVLRHELGNSHQAQKTLMKWTGANERTVKNWLSGAHGPSGEHLIHLIRNSDLVFETVLRFVGREAEIPTRTLSELRNSLVTTTELLSEVIANQKGPVEY